MDWVLRESDEKLGRRLVLLALADYAQDDGTNAWPSIDSIAHKARVSRRQTLRCLRELEAAGSIEREGLTSAKTVLWRVVMKGDNMSPCQDVTGDKSVHEEPETDENVTQPVIEEPSSTPVVPTEDPVERIFDYWRKVMKHPGAQLDDGRRRTIEKALKIATPHECAQAIRGCSRSEFHRATGQYRGGTVYDKLSLILRNREQMESFMAMAPQTASPSASDPLDSSVDDAKIRVYKLDVLAAHDLAGSGEAQKKGDESEHELRKLGIRVVRDVPDQRPRFERSDEPRSDGVLEVDGDAEG